MKHHVIPLWSYVADYRKNRAGMLAAVDRVFRSGKLILGSEVSSFEHEFSAFCHRPHGIGVGNGTDALFLSLKALGVGAGDEVITVPNTAIPTVSAITATGARPVFVDIRADTYLMDTEKIVSVITKKTKVILPVHLYGQCADMDTVMKIARKYRLAVLEDCAQATGARWHGKPAGSFGDIAAFSFYPTKTLGAYGDGGMVVTGNARLAKKIRELRFYGTRGSYYSYSQGYNSRLDEVQAALLRYQLARLKTTLTKRDRLAARYSHALAKTPLTLTHADPRGVPAWYVFVCRHPKRTSILAFLKKKGITANISYPFPLHTMKAFQFLGYKQGDFPVTERASREIFSLPFYPDLSIADQNRVVDVIKTFFQT